MLVASKIEMDCNCMGFYLVLQEMKSQFGMLDYCFAVFDGGYCHRDGFGRWILIATKLCH